MNEVNEAMFVEVLKPYFQARAYEWNSSLHQFRRQTDQGFTCIIISISPYPDVSIVEFHLGIRLDDVENVAYPYTNGLSGFRPDSMTLVTPLSRLYQQPFQRFTVANESDVQLATTTLIQQLEDLGWDFLDTYQHRPNLEQLFNQEPTSPLRWTHHQVHRAMRGITLAKLNQRQDLPQLIKQYEQLLVRQYATELEQVNFEALCQFLLNYSPN
ncbi:MAG: hypothetical protein AAGK47_06880 [Bacteroidota bacterium]